MATTGEPYGLFWDSQNGDRTYSAASFEYWLKKFFTSGVFNGDMQVKAISGMTLEIEPGYANVDGKVKFWNGAFNLTLNPANSTYPRIDTIVITRDNVNREITCEVVTGSYSADTPQPTAPIRNAEIYQLVLAQIYVGAGVTEITQSSITDTRPDNSLCGWITGTVTQLDFSQFTAQFEAYFAEFKADAEGDYAAWFNNVQQEQIEDKAAWDAWYAALQEELHELPPDSAEYLQVEIDELKESGLSGSIFKITTINSSLEGKSVSITNADGTEVKTGTFDSNLECMIYGMKSVGELTITSTDGIQTATSVISIPYFGNYVVPIAFWAATVNIQGDENLYGATITVKDSDNLTVGTVTLSAIDGTGTFIATKADTYTFNFTYQSVAYSQELAVTQETTYSLSLSAGFNWQTWVDTARFLDSSDYANLGEVLADEEAVRELCLEHNCVDYFCDISSVSNDVEIIINNDLFAKWANNSDYALDNMIANAAIKDAMDEADKYGYGEWVLVGQVPTMTSNSAPYGEAFASTEFSTSSNQAWKAFDGDNSNSSKWAPQNNATNNYVGYHFVSGEKIKRVHVVLEKNATGGALPDRDFKVQASNDNSTWTDLATFTVAGGSSLSNVIYETDVDITPSTEYAYYRLFCADIIRVASTYNINVCGLQFYAWAPKGNVPIMTANTTPYGSVITNSEIANSYQAFKAFDNDPTTRWSTDNNVGQGSYITYAFTNPIIAKAFELYPFWLEGQNALFVKGYQIEGSNDNFVNDVNILYSETLENANVGKFSRELNNNVAYRYYRLYATTNSYYVYGNISINALQFYGRELSVSVPKMDTNTTPYGEAISNNANIVANNYKVFDNTNSGSNDHVQLANTTSNNSRIGYDFGKPTCIKFIWGRNRADVATRSVKEFKIQGSNDATTWEDITLQALTNANNTANAIFVNKEIANNKAYRYIALLALEGTNNDHEVWIGQLQFFGLDYSEKEFEEGTTKKWLYDHGVELEDFGASGVTGVSPNIEPVHGNYQLEFNTNTSNQYSVVVTDNSIDLTDYSVHRIKFGDISKKDSQYGNVVVGTTKDIVNNLISNLQIATIDNPNEIGIDISSVNQNGYLFIVGGYNATRMCSIKEWWLE